MTKEEEKNLQILETRVRQLILAYKEMIAERQQLHEVVRSKENKIAELENENYRLRAEYDTLKMAKIIEVSSDDVKATRARLSKLAKEVDKCIALLNV